MFLELNQDCRIELSKDCTSFTFLTISAFLRNQSDTITVQATGRGHSNSRGSLEPGKDKNEEVFLISLIFPILMTKQCVNEEVIKDIFVMTCHEFPNHSISIISDDWHIWWDVCMSSCYSQSNITSMTSHYNDWYMCGIPSHIIYKYIYIHIYMTTGCICMSFCVAASTIISITFYYNDIHIWHPVTQYTYIIQLYIVYVVVFQPKYEQVPNQSTEPSRTEEVTISLVGSMFFWKYL